MFWKYLSIFGPYHPALVARDGKTIKEWLALNELCTSDDSCTPPYVRSIFTRLDKIEDGLSTKEMRSDDPEIEELSRPLKTAAEGTLKGLVKS